MPFSETLAGRLAPRIGFSSAGPGYPGQGVDGCNEVTTAYNGKTANSFKQWREVPSSEPLVPRKVKLGILRRFLPGQSPSDSALLLAKLDF